MLNKYFVCHLNEMSCLRLNQNNTLISENKKALQTICQTEHEL